LALHMFSFHVLALQRQRLLLGRHVVSGIHHWGALWRHVLSSVNHMGASR
jgi:hypothetical protein